jgi:hypothetical protein
MKKETGRGLTEEWSPFTWNDFAFFILRFAIIRVMSDVASLGTRAAHCIVTVKISKTPATG